MSNDKRTMSIDTTNIETTSSMQNLYQEFVAAEQHAKAYREKLAKYTPSAKEVLASEGNEILNIIDSGINELMNLSTSLYNWNSAVPTSMPTKKPSKAGQNIPTIQELSQLRRARDAAFFRYMDSIEQDMSADVDAFMPNDTLLISADHLIQPYYQRKVQFCRNLVAIQEKIQTLQNAQRTWIDFVIETFFPSFILKMMSYLPFQEVIAEKIKEQKNEYNVIVKRLEIQDTLFKTKWKSHFNEIDIPKDLKSFNSTELSKAVYAFNNKTVVDTYLVYQKEKTVDNLVKFYRLACQMEYIARNSEDHNKYDLEGIIFKLQQFHPNMADRLQQEQETVQTEMMLLDKYIASGDILTAKRIEQEKETLQTESTVFGLYTYSPTVLSALKGGNEEVPPKAKFLKELDDKYRAFLKDRTTDHFEALYQHIHQNPQFKHLTLVKETRKFIKTTYAQAYQSVRQHYIQHMDEATCDAFIAKYELWKYDHIIYTTVMKFMHEPTVEGLIKLKLILLGINDSAYDQDQRLNTFIADFMEICSKAPLTAVNEMRSERYSIGSVEEISSSGTLTPLNHSPDSRLRSFSDDRDLTSNMTVRALELHNLSQSQSDPRMFAKTTKMVEGREYTAVPNLEIR